MAANSQDFGESFLTFMKTMNAAAPRTQAFFPERIGAHFGGGAETLPIVSHKFPEYEHPNVQRALDDLAAKEREAGHPVDLVGITSEHKRYQPIALAGLLSPGEHYGAPTAGPVEYQQVEVADGQTISCIHCGLFLVKPGGTPLAVLVKGAQPPFGQGVELEVLAPTREAAEGFLSRLRSRVHALSVYRGHALSVELDQRHGLRLRFHRLPDVSRESIILPDAVLSRIERQTIGFSDVASDLAKSGRHLKRGVLLHGPPGTGKTLTAMYLAARMKGRTVVLATGRGHGALEYTCSIARSLQPATVVLEDVDLFATDREGPRDQCASPLLFELLNQMDGLAEDADILFVLTTNRPEALEPALASRPGRIDQAIEVPLPDETCRRRLIELYARGLDVRGVNIAGLVGRTSGASAAFIREALRRATLLACLDGRGPVLEDRHIDEALRELVISGGALTRRLLGFAGEPGK